MAALMMTACSQDEVVSVKQDGIDYSVVAGKQTRAADSYCNSDLPGSFKVWANADGELYINGDNIVRSGASWADEAGMRYWPENKSLDFFAEVNGDSEFQFNGGAPTFNNFTVKDGVTEQLDLMYAVQKNQTKSVGTVQLNFRHALSQVCFKAKNNTKNLRVSISGVSVGHLANNGLFTFPAESTSQNYTHPSHGDEIDPNAPDLNGGEWAVTDDYAHQYTATFGDVTLEPSSAANLTCPGDDHAYGFANVMTLMPQTVEAWNPAVTGADYNGAYFLVDLVLSNRVNKGTETEPVYEYVEIYSGQAAVPVSIAWQQGYRYIYTFVFDEGGNGGYTPDPSNPQPVLASIKYDVTVDDFIPVYGDGEDGTHMDTGTQGGQTTTTDYALTYDANGGTYNGGSTWSENVSSEEESHGFTVSNAVPTREGYTFLGWADTRNATSANYEDGDVVYLKKEAPTKTIYAVWERQQTTITLSYDLNGGSGRIVDQQQTVAAGTSATFSVTTDKPAKEGQYQFLGWSYARNTSDTPDLESVIAPGAEITLSASTTLYAVYGKTTPTYGGGGSGADKETD